MAGTTSTPSRQGREGNLSLISGTAFCLFITTKSVSHARRSLSSQAEKDNHKKPLPSCCPHPKACFFLFCWYFFLKSKNQKLFLASFQLLFSCSAMAISSRLNLTGRGFQITDGHSWRYFIWKNTSELKVLHLYSLLEGWKEINHPQGRWASVNLIPATLQGNYPQIQPWALGAVAISSAPLYGQSPWLVLDTRVISVMSNLQGTMHY